MNINKVELIYEVNDITIHRWLDVTPQTYHEIVEENIKEIARKNGLNESEITVRI